MPELKLNPEPFLFYCTNCRSYSIHTEDSDVENGDSKIYVCFCGNRQKVYAEEFNPQEERKE